MVYYARFDPLYRTYILKYLFHLPDGWNSKSHQFRKLEYGKWELTIAANPDGSSALKHGSRVQLIVNENLYRLSPWASYVKPFEGVTFQQFIYRPENVSILFLVVFLTSGFTRCLAPFGRSVMLYSL